MASSIIVHIRESFVKATDLYTEVYQKLKSLISISGTYSKSYQVFKETYYLKSHSFWVLMSYLVYL